MGLPVAVKKLDETGLQGREQFFREVEVKHYGLALHARALILLPVSAAIFRCQKLSRFAAFTCRRLSLFRSVKLSPPASSATHAVCSKLRVHDCIGFSPVALGIAPRLE